MKTCKNCKYYTGTHCYGHGEYYGFCQKKKDKIIVYDNTPCLQDINTLRACYVKQLNKITSLEYMNKELEFYKLRYESKCRLVNKIQDLTLIACKYIAKENLPKWRKENLEYLLNYQIPLKELEKIAKQYENQ